MDEYIRHPNMEKFMRTNIAKELGKNHRWTISENKKPLNIYKLIDGRTTNDGQFFGAETHDRQSLTTLRHILDHPLIHNVNNVTYYLNADFDNIVCLDIEPSCPNNLRNQFLKMPCLYAEWSTSGKGIHMFFDYPYDIQEKYKGAKGKTVMKGEHKFYEILIQHYVTFTGNTENLKFCYGKDPKEFRTLFRKLAKRQKISITKELNIQMTNLKQSIYDAIDWPGLPKLMHILETGSSNFHNTHDKEQYDYDESRYEFAYITQVYMNLESALKTAVFNGNRPITDDEKARILYEMASRHIKFRDKHNEIRNGMPWLYFEAIEAMRKTNLDPPPKSKNKGKQS